MGAYFYTLRLESPLEEDGRNSASQVDGSSKIILADFV
jgi:hypothetical protein